MWLEGKRQRNPGRLNPDPLRTLQCSRDRRLDRQARRSTAPAKACKKSSGFSGDQELLLRRDPYPHRLKLFSSGVVKADIARRGSGVFADCKITTARHVELHARDEAEGANQPPLPALYHNERQPSSII
jgi:hypothetical protein